MPSFMKDLDDILSANNIMEIRNNITNVNNNAKFSVLEVEAKQT